jgi:hypothetical protein
MNDIATVVLEHRNSNGDLQAKSLEFDVFVNDPYEINDRLKPFIRTKTFFPSDYIVVKQVASTTVADSWIELQKQLDAWQLLPCINHSRGGNK